jgi:hypothetical protein
MMEHPLDDLADVNECLHLAKYLLLLKIDKARGETRRRLKVIEGSVFDAIGSLACQGLTTDEFRAVRRRWAEEQLASFQ